MVKVGRCLRTIDVLEAQEVKETVEGADTLIALTFWLTLEDAHRDKAILRRLYRRPSDSR